MGCWDASCIICGAPPHNTDTVYLYDPKTKEESETTYPYAEETEWLNACTLLLPDGQTLHDYHESACNIGFKSNKKLSKKKSILINGLLQKTNIMQYPIADSGMWLHTDCWKYIQKYTGKGINYNNIPENLWIKSEYQGTIYGIDYDGIDKYVAQDFKFDEILKDNNHWLITSPLSNNAFAKKNKTRINKILGQIKLTKSEVNKRKNRPSPPISASLIPRMVYAIGNNGEVWITDSGKWKTTDNQFVKMIVNLDYPISKSTKLNNRVLDSLKLKHQLSLKLTTKNELIKNPIFINKYDVTTHSGKQTIKKGKFEFISTLQGFKQLLKFFEESKIKYTIID
jgi:hypothetical protein